MCRCSGYGAPGAHGLQVKTYGRKGLGPSSGRAVVPRSWEGALILPLVGRRAGKPFTRASHVWDLQSFHVSGCTLEAHARRALQPDNTP